MAGLARMTMIQQTFDLDANALYVRLSDQPVARTVQIDEGTLVDLDDKGAVVGIEVIQPQRTWPLGEILRRFQIPADQANELRAYFPQTPIVSPPSAHPAPIQPACRTQPSHLGVSMPVALAWAH